MGFLLTTVSGRQIFHPEQPQEILSSLVRRSQDSLVTATTMKRASIMTNLTHRGDIAKRISTKATRSYYTSLWIQLSLKTYTTPGLLRITSQ